MKVIVRVVEGANKGRGIPVQSGERATFGSSDAADVSLQDPELSGFHFAIHCDSAECTIRSLIDSHPVVVNGVPVEQVQLSDGDEVRAGQTQLAISFEGSFASEAPLPPTTDREEDAATPSIHQLCQKIELDEEGMELLKPEHTVDSFVQTLVAEERFIDAVRLLAYAMPKSQAVRWAHDGITTIGHKVRTAEDQSAMQATGRWIEESVEAHRWEALQSAEKLEFSTAPACAAAAAGWSGGSMVGPDLDPIEPDSLLTARMASLAIQIAALEVDDDGVDERYKQVIAMGQTILSQESTSSATP
ncbi:MAG: FHA domain-containing protein [Planctomycetota bacterium]